MKVIEAVVILALVGVFTISIIILMAVILHSSVSTQVCEAFIIDSKRCWLKGTYQFQPGAVQSIQGMRTPKPIYFCSKHYMELKCRSGRGTSLMGSMNCLPDYHKVGSLELVLRSQHMWKFGLIPFMNQGHFHYISKHLLSKEDRVRYGFPDVGQVWWNFVQEQKHFKNPVEYVFRHEMLHETKEENDGYKKKEKHTRKLLTYLDLEGQSLWYHE